MFQHTEHSAVRAAQRGLSEKDIEYVFEFGSCYHGAGCIIYYLRRQDVPFPDLRCDWARRLMGTALIVSKDDTTLVTAWRNRRTGLKQIRKKTAFGGQLYERKGGA